MVILIANLFAEKNKKINNRAENKFLEQKADSGSKNNVSGKVYFKRKWWIKTQIRQAK